MRTSAKGRDLIRKFEGEKLIAYLCPAGVWTIGVGHTGDVKPGQKISKEQSDKLLQSDLDRFEKAVANLVEVELQQHEFDALVSFAFNVGSGALAKSTLLKMLNAGDRKGAADQFLRWDKANGRVLAGLTARRKAERAMFMGGA